MMATSSSEVFDDSPARQGTILLFSPSFQGHRLIYCRVFARLLLQQGYVVVIAGRASSVSPGEALFEDLSQWSHVEILDTGRATGTGGTSLEDVAALTRDVDPKASFLMEADDLLPDFEARVGGSGGDMQGRVVGVFIRSTNYAHHPPLSPLARARDRILGQRSERQRSADFHERLLPRRHFVDAALVLDERFAASHARTHAWLPDVFREFDEPIERWRSETSKWDERLRSFLAASHDNPLIVYVGPADHRRGYDRLLTLAYEENGCFLHCGKRDQEYERADEQVRLLRADLVQRGALFETDATYIRPETADVFLQAARCVVLPYRDHDGSSGAMLQAVAANRPVLVPDRGLMAFRVRSFGLGATYRDGDMGDMRRQFSELQDRGPDFYTRALKDYVGLFSQAQVADALLAAVTGKGCGARLPQEVLGIAELGLSGVDR